MTLTTDVGWLSTLGDPGPTPEYVLRYAARAFNVSQADLTGRDRTHPVVHYRQVAMAAVVALTDEAARKVGRRFGGRDHATVAHSVERCQEVERLGRALEKLVAACRRQWAIDNGEPDPGQQSLGLEG